MRYLLDTHVWLWLLGDPDKVAPSVLTLLSQAEELVLSTASVWEAAIKARLGKLLLPQGVAHARAEFLAQTGSRELQIGSTRAIAASELPPIHRDPFDRILVAQAQLEELVLVTADDILRRYQVPVQWAL